MTAAPSPAPPGTREIRRWLAEAALPLWATAGIDPRGPSAREALDHDGSPLVERAVRLRVQPRQAFVYAQAARHIDPGYLALAQDLFAYAMTRGVEAGTGNLASVIAPDGTIAQAPHDLYDLAFMHLAAAALIEAGAEGMAPALAWLDAALDRLKAPWGWDEDAARTLPRRQNPHMHLFEAAVELHRVTGAPRYLGIARECRELFVSVFLQDDGRLFEFFESDWQPVPKTHQGVEPGHMVEWIWLLDRYERTTGSRAGPDPAALLDAALEGRVLPGALCDALLPDRPTRRLWPQTEYLRAALALRRRGLLPARADTPETILARLWKSYLAGAGTVPGGWSDKLGPDGTRVSADMPASSFYHVWGALLAVIEAG